MLRDIEVFRPRRDRQIRRAFGSFGVLAIHPLPCSALLIHWQKRHHLPSAGMEDSDDGMTCIHDPLGESFGVAFSEAKINSLEQEYNPSSL
jgi:hypothetical protein